MIFFFYLVVANNIIKVGIYIYAYMIHIIYAYMLFTQVTAYASTGTEQ